MSHPPPSADERGLLTFLDKLDEESRMAKELAASSSWDRWSQIERGQDWPDKHRAPMWKANPIKSTIARKAALLTETKPSLRILPRRPGLDQTAKTLEHAIDAGWDEYGVEQSIETNAHTMGTFGCGFFKLPYDPQANFGEGDLAPLAIDPRNVRIDPSVTKSYELARAQYVIIDDIQPLWLLWKRFPTRGTLVTPDSRFSSLYADTSTPSLLNTMLSKMQSFYRSGGESVKGAIPRAYVREYQFIDPTINDDGTPRYPNGRFVLRGGDDVVLQDRPNPYWDGGWDLEMIDSMPDLDHPWGTSEVEMLRRVQEAMNRVGDLFVRNRVTSGNMRVIADSNALESDGVKRLESLNAIVLTRRFGTQIDWHMPENMPPDMMQFVDQSIRMIDYLAGLSEPTIDGRFEVRSGTQFEGLQAASQTLIRATARRLENYLQRIGQKWISRIFQFYTADRLLPFLGPGAEFQTFTFEREMLMRDIVAQAQRQVQEKVSRGETMDQDELSHVITQRTQVAFRDFRFKISPGSSLASTKLQRAMLFANFAMNGILPREKVLEEVGFANPKELIEQAMREAQVLGMPNPPKGKR